MIKKKLNGKVKRYYPGVERGRGLLPRISHIPPHQSLKAHRAGGAGEGGRTQTHVTGGVGVGGDVDSPVSSFLPCPRPGVGLDLGADLR